MPNANSLMNQLFACFGHFDQQTPVRETEPPRISQAPARTVQTQDSVNRFVEGQRYSLRQLCNFCRKRAYTANTRTPLLQAMGEAICAQPRDKPERARAMALLAMHMTEDDGVDFLGAPRQANYFANYAVDLMFEELDEKPNPTLETQLRRTVNHWINSLVPAQDTFNICGIIYTREEVQSMLDQDNFYRHRQAVAHDEVQTELSNLFQGKKGAAQSVHSSAVRFVGAEVLSRLKIAGKNSTIATATEANTILQQEFEKQNLPKDVLADVMSAAERMCDSNTIDACWSVHTSPSEIMLLLSRYILSHPDNTLKNALLESLSNRLLEITREEPCITGQLQRLLDVPSGIDPALGGAGREMQVSNDLSHLAAKVNGQFTTLIDEDAERAKATGLEHNPIITSTVGRDMFRHRATVDMPRLYGVAEHELEPELSRLETGFNS